MSAHHCDPNCTHGTITIQLTLAEQRKLAEHEAGGPCFRMWVTKAEFEKAAFADWTAYPIDGDHISIWRKHSDVRALLASKDSADRDLGMMLQSRMLPDERDK